MKGRKNWASGRGWYAYVDIDIILANHRSYLGSRVKLIAGRTWAGVGGGVEVDGEGVLGGERGRRHSRARLIRLERKLVQYESKY